ncbi:MAG: hypothetical protein AAGH15_07275 [Myxococcota bacterium]
MRPPHLAFRVTRNAVGDLHLAFRVTRKPVGDLQHPFRVTRKPLGNLQHPFRVTRKPLGNLHLAFRVTRNAVGNLQHPFRVTRKPEGNLHLAFRVTRKPLGNLQQAFRVIRNAVGDRKEPSGPAVRPLGAETPGPLRRSGADTMLRAVRTPAFSTFVLLVCAACGTEDPLPGDLGMDGGDTDLGTTDAGLPDGGMDAEVDAGDGGTGPARAIWTLPRTPSVAGEPGYFDHPWPSDFRVVDGALDLAGFPNPRRVGLLDDVLATTAETVTGWSVAAPIYFRFGAPIDQRNLPETPGDAQTPGAVVQLIDVDPESPDRGTSQPLAWHFWEPETNHWPGNTLAVRPVHGLLLRPATTYAAVVTTGLFAADGRAFVPDDDLEAILATGGDAAITAAREQLAPHLAILEASVPREDILSLAVFTTQDPTREMEQLRDWLMEQPTPAPVEAEWDNVRTGDSYTLFRGAYETPIVQDGEIPYTSRGGAIRLDEVGAPATVQTTQVRVSMTIPITEAPPEGYPVVLYAHGTGGDWETYFRNRIGPDLADLGIASVGVDQIHHGERNPTETDPALLFFNVANPIALRDNIRQSGLDLIQQARFVRQASPDAPAEGLEIPFVVAERTIQLDPNNVMLFGHSQGGQNGPLALAMDDQLRGALLSGAGGHLPIALVDKTLPFDIPTIVSGLLRVDGTEEHLVVEHPVLAVLQTFVDAADPLSFAPFFFEAPREGFAPKSVFMTEGITDPFTPPDSIEALAAAARIPLLGDERATPEGLEVLGLVSGPGTARDNVAGGTATGGLVQYGPAMSGGTNRDHFVVFDEAREAALAFLASLAAGTPAIQPELR